MENSVNNLINFVSSEVAEEERVMHSRSDNIKFTSFIGASAVVDELFESACLRYQRNLKTSMRGSDFIFDSVQLIYSKCHKVNLCGGSYIDSPDQIKKKKAIINPEHMDGKSFQYAATVALSGIQKE